MIQFICLKRAHVNLDLNSMVQYRTIYFKCKIHRTLIWYTGFPFVYRPLIINMWLPINFVNRIWIQKMVHTHWIHTVHFEPMNFVLIIPFKHQILLLKRFLHVTTLWLLKEFRNLKLNRFVRRFQFDKWIRKYWINVFFLYFCSYARRIVGFSFIPLHWSFPWYFYHWHWQLVSYCRLIIMFYTVVVKRIMLDVCCAVIYFWPLINWLDR